MRDWFKFLYNLIMIVLIVLFVELPIGIFIGIKYRNDIAGKRKALNRRAEKYKDVGKL